MNPRSVLQKHATPTQLELMVSLSDSLVLVVSIRENVRQELIQMEKVLHRTRYTGTIAMVHPHTHTHLHNLHRDPGRRTKRLWSSIRQEQRPRHVPRISLQLH